MRIGSGSSKRGGGLEQRGGWDSGIAATGQPRGASGVPPWSEPTLATLAAEACRRPYARVTPSDACGLGRASGAATPASPSSRAKRPGCHDRRSACGSQATGKFASANFRTTGLLRGFRAFLARPQGTAPEGDNAGIGPATRLGSERDKIMASKSSTSNTAQPARRTQPVRQSITLELVKAHAPHAAVAENLARIFGISPVDYAAVREGTEEHLVRSANTLRDDLNDKAMAIHLQRIVGAFVSSAHGAATFYGTKVTAARDLTAKGANDDRDEDRDGPSGFESKAERARQFAAEMGLQAFALMAAAEGAVHAYAHITGDDWKPYEPPIAPGAGISRQSADAQLGAFG